MSNATEKIEQLEGSIAHVQGLLDDAQKVLSVADETQRRADAIAANVRRTVIVVTVAGLVLALLALVRRRAHST